jgi:N-acetyl-D-muramate 6-phosphate phosphatase
MRRYRAVLFDLDGTLADTASDLGYALNLQRTARGLEALPLAAIRPFASAGARGLLHVGFGLEPEHADYAAMRSEFLELYAAHLSHSTVLFPEMAQTLAELERLNVQWGVVTNKPQRFTVPLLAALGLRERSACIVCADMVANPKPDPASLLEAARQLGHPPGSCVYVGDDERDVQAARAAGMDAVVALYGYLGNGSRPESWGARASIRTPLQLFELPGLIEAAV